jgi:hypothetical protein
MFLLRDAGNRRSWRPAGLSAPLRREDEVMIVCALSGG